MVSRRFPLQQWFSEWVIGFFWVYQVCTSSSKEEIPQFFQRKHVHRRSHLLTQERSSTESQLSSGDCSRGPTKDGNVRGALVGLRLRGWAAWKISGEMQLCPSVFGCFWEWSRRGDYGRYHHHGEWVMSLTRGWLVISCFVFLGFSSGFTCEETWKENHGFQRKRSRHGGSSMSMFTYGAGLSTPMDSARIFHRNATPQRGIFT